PIMWESHSFPAVGGGPQAIINRQLVDNCDFVVGAFWTRLGTPTEDSESGTVEEVDRLRRVGKPAMLYFSSAPVVPESIDRDQYRRLTQYREQMEREGLVVRYADHAQFRQEFSRHLAMQMTDLISQYRRSTPSAAPDDVVADTVNEDARNLGQ